MNKNIKTDRQLCADDCPQLLINCDNGNFKCKEYNVTPLIQISINSEMRIARCFDCLKDERMLNATS